MLSPKSAKAKEPNQSYRDTVEEDLAKYRAAIDEELAKWVPCRRERGGSPNAVKQEDTGQP